MEQRELKACQAYLMGVRGLGAQIGNFLTWLHDGLLCFPPIFLYTACIYCNIYFASRLINMAFIDRAFALKLGHPPRSRRWKKAGELEAVKLPYLEK